MDEQMNDRSAGHADAGNLAEAVLLVVGRRLVLVEEASGGEDDVVELGAVAATQPEGALVPAGVRVEREVQRGEHRLTIEIVEIASDCTGHEVDAVCGLLGRDGRIRVVHFNLLSGSCG